MKAKKVYFLNIELGTHRGMIKTTHIDLELWVRDLAKEFKIYTEVTNSLKKLYIYNYWGEKQIIGYILSK